MSFGEESGLEQGKQSFKYNGKELDKEHGLNQYDYAARFMDPSMGRFTSVDPLAEKKPWMSPYIYCSNNPINRIDPDGRDDYRLDRDGNMTFVKETKADNHTIYAVNSKGELDKKNSHSVSKYIINNSSKKTINEDDNSITLNTYSIFDSKDAEDFFKFVANNSNVEWSNTSISYQDGKGNSLNYNLVSTSHHYGNESSIGYLLYNINEVINQNSIVGDQSRYNINFLNHSHTNGSTSPSGQERYDGSISGDIGVAIRVHKINGHTKSTFDIYNPITKQNRPYKASDRPWELNKITVTP